MAGIVLIDRYLLAGELQRCRLLAGQRFGLAGGAALGRHTPKRKYDYRQQYCRETDFRGCLQEVTSYSTTRATDLFIGLFGSGARLRDCGVGLTFS